MNKSTVTWVVPIANIDTEFAAAILYEHDPSCVIKRSLYRLDDTCVDNVILLRTYMAADELLHLVTTQPNINFELWINKDDMLYSHLEDLKRGFTVTVIEPEQSLTRQAVLRNNLSPTGHYSDALDYIYKLARWDIDNPETLGFNMAYNVAPPVWESVEFFNSTLNPNGVALEAAIEQGLVNIEWITTIYSVLRRELVTNGTYNGVPYLIANIYNVNALFFPTLESCDVDFVASIVNTPTEKARAVLFAVSDIDLRTLDVLDSPGGRKAVTGGFTTKLKPDFDTEAVPILNDEELDILSKVPASVFPYVNKSFVFAQWQVTQGKYDDTFCYVANTPYLFDVDLFKNVAVGSVLRVMYVRLRDGSYRVTSYKRLHDDTIAMDYNIEYMYGDELRARLLGVKIVY